MSLLTLTTREMCRIECGHLGIFLVDVESKSFPDVVKVVQKLESSRVQIEGVRCDTVLPKSAEIHDTCIRPKGRHGEFTAGRVGASQCKWFGHCPASPQRCTSLRGDRERRRGQRACSRPRGPWDRHRRETIEAADMVLVQSALCDVVVAPHLSSAINVAIL